MNDETLKRDKKHKGILQKSQKRTQRVGVLDESRYWEEDGGMIVK
jgi:hypothetical protein